MQILLHTWIKELLKEAFLLKSFETHKFILLGDVAVFVTPYIISHAWDSN